MDNAFLSPERQGLLLLYSLLLGISLGILFGLFKLPLNIAKELIKKRTFKFTADLVCDIIISVVYTLAVVIFIYAANEGVIRYFMIAASFIGLLLYHFSLGRILNKLAAVIAQPIYAFGVCVYKGIKKACAPLSAFAGDMRVRRYVRNKLRTGLVWRLK